MYLRGFIRIRMLAQVIYNIINHNTLIFIWKLIFI